VTFAEKTVVSILLLVARLIAPYGWKSEIKAVADAINLWTPERKEPA
jgi:hypothetical protein